MRVFTFPKNLQTDFRVGKAKKFDEAKGYQDKI
jgi:hypothetical protein